MTLNEYFIAANTRFLIFKEERLGQAYFNTLDFFYRELANEIRGTDLDPFYDSSKMIVFMQFLAENWDG